MKANVNEIWELIDSLSIEEKRVLYKRMQNQINEKLSSILDKTNDREKEPVSVDEITDEVEEVRSKRE